jgi:hypothetical protein
VLLAYAGRGEPEAEPFITLAGSMAGLIGFMITYPEWRQEDVPPIPYPPTVAAGAIANPVIMNCGFLNAYEAIHFDGTGRFLIRNVHGYPLKRGIYIDMCLDIGRIENVHFWPFGGFWSQDDPLSLWVNRNGVAFEFARYDWCYVLNTFCFGYGIGYRFSRSPRADAAHGVTNGNLLGIGADCCDRPVYVEETSEPGLQITNGEFVAGWTSRTSIGVECADDAARAMVNLTNCAFWGPFDRCVRMSSPNAHLTVSGCTFKSWNCEGTDAPAVDMEAGKLILQGSSFLQAGPHVRIGEDVRSALVFGNQGVDGFVVRNQAERGTQVMLNEQSPVRWTEQARLHYRIDAGSPGDSAYLTRFHTRERMAAGADDRPTLVWAAPDAGLRLPVAPNRAYGIELHLHIPEVAAVPGAGLYLEEECVIPFPEQGAGGVLRGEIPAADRDEVSLEFRCGTWRPIDEIPGSGDRRTLGLQLDSVTVRAEDAGQALFNANTGAWIQAPPDEAEPRGTMRSLSP